MHLSLSNYGRVDTTQGELSLHWRVDKTTTAVICFTQSNAHSGILVYAVTPRSSHVLSATPEWRRTLRLKSTVPIAKRGQFPSLSPQKG